MGLSVGRKKSFVAARAQSFIRFVETVSVEVTSWLVTIST